MSERLQSNTSENSDWLDQWNELADRKRIDKFKENAAQELIERELNSELTKVDDLFNAVRAHEEGIKGTRATLNFDNGEQGNVTLFVLEGYPLKILQSSISIYNTNDLANNDEYGQTHQTVDQLIEDPSFWMKKQNEVEGLGKSTSAVLSASYFDTNIGITDMTGYGCCYAFDHVRPRSVVQVHKGDNNTLSKSEIQQPELTPHEPDGDPYGTPYLTKNINQKEKPPVSLEELANMETPFVHDYNELVINRYDEQGNPVKPDYILVRGDVNSNYGVTNISARHAIFHNIPLVCISPNYYKNIKATEYEEDIENEKDY